MLWLRSKPVISDYALILFMFKNEWILTVWSLAVKIWFVFATRFLGDVAVLDTMLNRPFPLMQAIVTKVIFFYSFLRKFDTIIMIGATHYANCFVFIWCEELAKGNLPLSKLSTVVKCYHILWYNKWRLIILWSYCFLLLLCLYFLIFGIPVELDVRFCG